MSDQVEIMRDIPAVDRSVLSDQDRELFFLGCANLASAVFANAINKGFHDDILHGGELDHCRKLVLIHSEVSEVTEALRDGNPPSKKIPEFSQAEEELADAVIRILDYGQAAGWNIPGAVLAKHDYNRIRPRMHGGRKF